MATPGYNDDDFPRKFGNYHLLAPLAQGGMGALYLAVRGDRGLERLLVIKTVLPHLADAEYIARFRDEAKVVVKLSHANLIPVFDAGTVDGELFLAMDFVEGRDLRAVWNRCAKKQVAFPIDVAVYIVKELCRGLGYAHSFRGLELVHRDVSPPNVLISFSGEVKVMDFGLANSSLKMEKTAPGIIYGKVAYMSPEQARGEPLDGRSDLYAAAIVLWELLTGRQLFPPGKDQPHDLLERARNPTPMPPSRRAPRVPAELDSICLKGLAPDRADRYADGEEFRQALSDWLASEAPGTDAARIEAFLYDLFAEDIERERAEREALLQKMRNRAKTMPPSDELRQMFESDGLKLLDPSEDETLGDSLRRANDKNGRRASDRGEEVRDRRRNGDRRRSSMSDDESDHDGELTSDGESPNDGPDVPQVGQIIDNRYRILALMGEGGMGRVYRAEHVEIGRQVAMKILHPVYSRMPDLVERFRREARAATRIGHPHIVDVTDSGTTHKGSAYFVMELLEGEELADTIAREGALDTRRVLRVAIQICRALAAAHQAGIVHRDLKPENIFLITRDGVPDFVKVLDFGVATGMDSGKLRTKRLTTPGTTMGTPEYMAPEQAAGQMANERCDIYALGSILYESLTGVAPYAGDNFMEILTKKATVDPESIDKLRPELPPRLAELVMRAMDRKPELRPASMDAFAAELEACLIEREPVATSNPSLAQARFISHPGLSEGTRPETNRPVGHQEPEPTVAVTRTVEVRSRWLLFGLLGLGLALIGGIAVVLMVVSKEPAATEVPDARSMVMVPLSDAGAQIVAPIDVPRDASPESFHDGALPVDAGEAAADADSAPATDRISDDEAENLLKEAARLFDKLAYGKARNIYQRVASKSGSSQLRAQAYLGLAKVAFQENNTAAVIRHAKRARRAGWEADLLLARAYHKQRNFGQALAHYRRVLEKKPSHGEARQMVEKLQNAPR